MCFAFNVGRTTLHIPFYDRRRGVVTAYITEQMKNEKYMAPEAEVLEIAVEQGFATSPGDGGSEGTEDEELG